MGELWGLEDRAGNVCRHFPEETLHRAATMKVITEKRVANRGGAARLWKVALRENRPVPG